MRVPPRTVSARETERPPAAGQYFSTVGDFVGTTLQDCAWICAHRWHGVLCRGLCRNYPFHYRLSPMLCVAQHCRYHPVSSCQISTYEQS